MANMQIEAHTSKSSPPDSREVLHIKFMLSYNSLEEGSLTERTRKGMWCLHRSTVDLPLPPVLFTVYYSCSPFSHGNKEVFSCRGIQLAVNFFLDRGHDTVTVFVPTWRKEQPRPDAPITGEDTGNAQASTQMVLIQQNESLV